jgi:hypothetical protein
MPEPRPRGGEPREHVPRPVVRAVVDIDHLEGPAAGERRLDLREERRDIGRLVAHGDDDRDLRLFRFGHQAFAGIAAFKAGLSRRWAGALQRRAAAGAAAAIRRSRPRRKRGRHPFNPLAPRAVSKSRPIPIIATSLGNHVHSADRLKHGAALPGAGYWSKC